MGGWRRCVGGVGHGAASFTIRGGHCSAAKRYRHGGRYRSDQAYFATCASVSLRIDTSSPSIPAIPVMPKSARLMVVVALKPAAGALANGSGPALLSTTPSVTGLVTPKPDARLVGTECVRMC